MALGLVYGRGHLHALSYQTPEDARKYWENKQHAWSFCETFQWEFGSTIFGDIKPKVMGRDYDTMNPEELKQFIVDGVAKKCCLLSEKASQIAAEIILEESQHAT